MHGRKPVWVNRVQSAATITFDRHQSGVFEYLQMVGDRLLTRPAVLSDLPRRVGFVANQPQNPLPLRGREGLEHLINRHDDQLASGSDKTQTPTCGLLGQPLAYTNSHLYK